MKKIVCFGDSVTQGVPHVHVNDTFPKLLERRLSQRNAQAQRVVCINSGVGGENTVEGLARFQTAVVDHEPDVVIVEFGLNDIRYEPEKTVPPDQFTANLLTINEQIGRIGARAIFTTPNPIVNACHAYSRDTDYYDRWGGCNGAVIEYAELVRQAAGEAEALLCDVYEAFITKAIDLEFSGACSSYADLTCLGAYISTADGVHPTVLGQILIASALYRVIVTEDLIWTVGQIVESG